MALAPASPEDLAAFRSITSLTEVAAFLGTSSLRLSFHLYAPKRPSYRSFQIKKASGGHRQIAAPPPVLMLFQRRLLSCLVALVPPKPNVHGFTKDRGVRTNAAGHVMASVVLNLDLLDFFPSITFGRVHGMFRKHPFNFEPNVASILAHLCCFQKVLPQGAPTSPMISNLICRGLDKELSHLARSHSCSYSRYCDDLTFSTTGESFPNALVHPSGTRTAPILGDALRYAIERNGFRVNDKKTRVRRRTERQEVTGLTVNEKVNVPRRFVRNIRSILHDCENRGVEAADARFGVIDNKTRAGKRPRLLDHTIGKLAYLGMVRGDGDPIYLRLAMRSRQAFALLSKPVRIAGPAALTAEFLRSTMWVLLGRNAAGDVLVEGTAFTLCAVGIVTAAHLFEQAVCVRYELRPGHDASVSYPIAAIRRKDGLDLAIVETAAPRCSGLTRAAMTVAVTDPVTVAGYPTWISPADDLFVTRAFVTQRKTAGGVDYLLIDKDIRGGNSGGPVLSKDGGVVGVAVYGRDSSIAPNGSLLVRHMDEVVAESPRPPFGD